LLLLELFDAFEVLSGVDNVAGSRETLLSSELVDPFDVLSGEGNTAEGSGMYRRGSSPPVIRTGRGSRSWLWAVSGSWSGVLDPEAISNSCLGSFGGVGSSDKGSCSTGPRSETLVVRFFRSVRVSGEDSGLKREGS
jgi:hypothetical protein